MTRMWYALLFLLISSSLYADPLARVGSHVLTDANLNQLLSEFGGAKKKSILSSPHQKQFLIDEWIDREALLWVAEHDGLIKDPVVKKRVEDAQKSVLVAELIEKKVGPQLTEQAVKKFYDDNPVLFSTDQVNIEHILVPTFEKAQEVLEAVKKGGSSFSALARRFSIDPNVEANGGSVGWATRDRFPEEFSEVAFAAKEGEVVGPVQTLFGFHVIKVLKRKTGRVLDFSEVQVRATQILRARLTRAYVLQARALAPKS